MIPLGTDAPIYHYPFVTVALIVANVIAFASTGAGMNMDSAQQYVLSHGDGLQPTQWVTSNFIHGGFGHLIGNMIFLWGFGLLVEGKLGWWKFLLVYLGIGVAQCSLEQTFMLGYDEYANARSDWAKFQEEVDTPEEQDRKRKLIETALREIGQNEDQIRDVLQQFDENNGELEQIQSNDDFADPEPSFSFGASAILYGLLAISLVWAPRNEVTILVIIFYRAATFEVTILTFGGWYIGLEVLSAVFGGLSMGSATLHAMGALIGFGVGVALFKLKLVDCEHWDLFAVMSGHYGPWARDRHGNPIERDGAEVKIDFEEPDEKKKKKKAPTKAVRKKKLGAVAEFVESGDFMRAVDELHNLRLRDIAAIPDEETMKELAAGLAKEQLYDDAVPIMQDYIKAFPETANGMRLRLANVFLKSSKPAGALKTLQEIDQDKLTSGQTRTLKKLLNAARAR